MGPNFITNATEENVHFWYVLKLKSIQEREKKDAEGEKRDRKGGEIEIKGERKKQKEWGR